MMIKPKEVRKISQEEVDIIANYVAEIDGEEIVEDLKKSLLNDYTYVFVFEFGVFIISTSFNAMFLEDINTKEKNMCFDQMVQKFFISKDGECSEVGDDELMYTAK